LALALHAAGLGSSDWTLRPHVTLARRLGGPVADEPAAAVPLRRAMLDYALCESLPGRCRQLQRYPSGDGAGSTAMRGAV